MTFRFHRPLGLALAILSAEAATLAAQDSLTSLSAFSAGASLPAYYQTEAYCPTSLSMDADELDFSPIDEEGLESALTEAMDALGFLGSVADLAETYAISIMRQASGQSGLDGLASVELRHLSLPNALGYAARLPVIPRGYGDLCLGFLGAGDARLSVLCNSYSLAAGNDYAFRVFLSRPGSNLCAIFHIYYNDEAYFPTLEISLVDYEIPGREGALPLRLSPKAIIGTRPLDDDCGGSRKALFADASLLIDVEFENGFRPYLAVEAAADNLETNDVGFHSCVSLGWRVSLP